MLHIKTKEQITKVQSNAQLSINKAEENWIHNPFLENSLKNTFACFKQ